MSFEQAANEVGRHRRARHVPQDRRSGENPLRTDDRPEQPQHSNALSATRSVPSMPTEVGSAGITGGIVGQQSPEDGIARVRKSLQRLERKEMIKEKEKAGCVVRAVESAFRARATVQETEERLTDIRVNANNKGTYENLRADDIRRVTEYYESLKTHDSQLGKAMRDYTLSVREMTLDEIKEAIQNGGKVLASTRIKYKGEDVQHLMHVDYFDSTGRFVDVSDNGSVEVSAPSYFCFVFDKVPEMDGRLAS